jgi:hypothetical protein
VKENFTGNQPGGWVVPGVFMEDWEMIKFHSPSGNRTTIPGLSSPQPSLYAVWGSINPLTPELNPSAQRCLTRFLLGMLLIEPCISLLYA